jgi:hypothetical protein
MKIVEIIDPRFLPLYSPHHLASCKDCFHILATIGRGEIHRFLVWPGGKITVRHAISNKRLGRLKTKEVVLEENMCRCVVGSFGESGNWMTLKEEDSDYWTLRYNPATDVKIMDEIMWLLHRLKP